MLTTAEEWSIGGEVLGYCYNIPGFPEIYFELKTNKYYDNKSVLLPNDDECGCETLEELLIKMYEKKYEL